MNVTDLDDASGDNLEPLTPTDQAADYELISVVVFVKDPENEEKNNLVSLVKVEPSYFERADQPESKVGSWFMFNDFA